MTTASPVHEISETTLNNSTDFQPEHTANIENTSTYNAGQTQTAVEPSTKQESPALRSGVERTRTGRVYTPAVDIYETKDAVVLLADVPSVDQNSIDVTLEKDVLTIYGHVNWPTQEGHNLAYAEYGMGDFQRSFNISNQIAWDRIEGTVKDGVLKLTLPKTGPAEAKKINIKAS